jgi:transcription initiation factor IIE alpha subunit
MTKAKELILFTVRNNPSLASNYRKVYVDILYQLGYELTEEVYINQLGISEATVNRGLEKLLSECRDVERCLAYDFTLEDYEYLYKISTKGRKAKQEIHDREISYAERLANATQL